MKRQLSTFLIWLLCSVVWVYITVCRLTDGSDPIVYILTGFTALLSIANAVIHLIKYLRTKNTDI